MMADGIAWYTLDDGTKARRADIVKLIEKVLENGEMNVPDIGKKIKLYPQAVHNIIKYMMSKDMLLSRKTQRWTLYKLPEACLLTSVLHPEFKKIIELSKRTKGIKRTIDTCKNVSYPSKILSHAYGQGYVNYEANE
jgi:predicted transcriptional regulator